MGNAEYMGRSQKGLKRSVIQWKITKAKMKILWVFVILATVNGNQEVCPKVTDASGDEVVSNRWGKAEGDLPDCWKPCGKCEGGEGEGDKCTTPMCRKDQCGWYGECVAPYECRCPRKYTRVIKLHETGIKSGEVAEVSCKNQSIDGFVNGFIPTVAILVFLIIAFNALTGVPKMCVEKED